MGGRIYHDFTFMLHLPRIEIKYVATSIAHRRETFQPRGRHDIGGGRHRSGPYFIGVTAQATGMLRVPPDRRSVGSGLGSFTSGVRILPLLDLRFPECPLVTGPFEFFLTRSHEKNLWRGHRRAKSALRTSVRVPVVSGMKDAPAVKNICRNSSWLGSNLGRRERRGVSKMDLQPERGKTYL